MTRIFDNTNGIVLWASLCVYIMAGYSNITLPYLYTIVLLLCNLPINTLSKLATCVRHPYTYHIVDLCIANVMYI